MFGKHVVAAGFACIAIVAGRPVVLRAQAGGIPPEWEVQKNIAALAAHAQRLKPILDQIKPQEWVAQGAPDGYIAQLKSTQVQLQGLAYSAGQLIDKPDKLTAALDAFFRVESLGAMLRSLDAGVRKYQNSALADLLESVVAEGSTNRERLRQYITELAADKEQQFKIVDEEAQRCRSTLSRQPPARKADGKKEERR